MSTSSCTPPGQGGPRTLPYLLDAFDEQMRGAPQATPATLDGQVVHQETFLLQHLVFELAVLEPWEWVEIVVCVRLLQRGSGQHSAVTDVVSHLANHLAQFTAVLFRPVLPPTLAVWASLLGSCQCWSAVVLIWFQDCDLRRVRRTGFSLPILQSVSCHPLSASHVACSVGRVLCIAAVWQLIFWQRLILHCKTGTPHFKLGGSSRVALLPPLVVLGLSGRAALFHGHRT